MIAWPHQYPNVIPHILLRVPHRPAADPPSMKIGDVTGRCHREEPHGDVAI